MPFLPKGRLETSLRRQTFPVFPSQAKFVTSTLPRQPKNDGGVGQHLAAFAKGKSRMDRVRLLAPRNSVAPAPCSRCGLDQDRWDRIAGKSYCPNCQEDLALGEARPIIERAEKNRCVICSKLGTIRFLTYPLRASSPVEMDLCAEHLRNLVGRFLRPWAFRQLSRQLDRLGLASGEVFLLHDAFYDRNGKALQPAFD